MPKKTISERIEREKGKLVTLLRQEQLIEARELEAKRKRDTRRNLIIGEIVCKYYPYAEQLVPKKSKADNDAEFAQLDRFFQQLFSVNEAVAKLEKSASAPVDTDNTNQID
ncbi:MAG: hypothetical protein FWD97_09930 [Defluviitaleaceae bacterium]|nr:hypothetical protein [Defluviitaleaceae bacterium]